MDNIVFDTSKNFLEKLWIELENIEVINESWNIYNIKIKSPDSSLIIGYSWKNLEDIRLVLKLVLSKIINESIVIHLEVNDYIEQKESKLISFVSKKNRIS